MMNEDDVSEIPEEDPENSNTDVEDGLSFASSQLPDGSIRYNPNTEVSLLGDMMSESTPTTSNPGTKKQVAFKSEEKEEEEEDDIFETNVTGMKPFSDSEDSNTKLDREIAKIEDEVDAEEEAAAVDIAASASISSENKYDLGGPISSGDGAYDLSKGYDLGKSPITTLPKDDDETSLTQQRSGSSDFALHSWMKRKDWSAIREFFRKPPKDINKLRSVINFSNEDGESPLHIGARRKCPLDIVKTITDKGGRQTVLASNNYGRSNALHHACHFSAPPDVVDHLVAVGGAEAVKAVDDIGNTPLQWALSKRLPFSNIKHLVEIGGAATASMPNRIGWTPLHTACYFDADTKIIKYLVEVCGSDCVRTLDKKFRTPLDLALERNSYCVESILVLLQQLSDIDEISLYLPQKTINSILEWVRLQTSTAAFEYPIVQRILNESFISKKYLTVWMVDLYLQIIIVAIISFGIDPALRGYGQRIGATQAAFLYISICWLLFREAIQVITTPFNEFVSDLKNWIDVTQVVLLFLTLDVLFLKGGVQTFGDASVVIATSGLVWINLLSVLGRGFYKIRVYIVYLKLLIWNLMPFFFGSTCIIAAFAQMYYIANNYFIGACQSPMIYTEDQDWTCTLGDTYFMTFASIVTGHWRFMEQPSGSAMTVLSFALAVVTVLLLFTSLVGQVFSLNDELYDIARVSFWTTRLSTMIEISDFNETLCCCYCQCCCRPELAVDDSPHWKVENKDQVTPKSRFGFDKAEKYRSFPEDDDLMREWWIGDDDRVPTLRNRAMYFMKWAPLSEILVPGRVAERMLSGHPKDAESYLWRVLSYILCPFLLVLLLIVFVLGLATLGLLWPTDMKKLIFGGTETLSRKQREVVTKSQNEIVKNTIEAVRSEMKGDKILKESMETSIADLHRTLTEMSKQLKALNDDATTTNGSFFDDEDA